MESTVPQSPPPTPSPFISVFYNPKFPLTTTPRSLHTLILTSTTLGAFFSCRVQHFASHTSHDFSPQDSFNTLSLGLIQPLIPNACLLS